METRKLIIYGFIAFMFFAVFLLIYFAFFYKSEKATNLEEKEKTFPTYIPSPTFEVIKVTERINAGGARVLDFNQFAQQKLSNNVVTIRRNNDFLLSYYPQGDYFHLSIINSPFMDIKMRAEKELLNLLKISEDDACQLNLTITTPFSANRQESGTNYKLSFCE